MDRLGNADQECADLHRVGGVPALLKYLLKETDWIDGSRMTVTGKTLAENVADGAFASTGSQSVELIVGQQRLTSTLRSKT